MVGPQIGSATTNRAEEVPTVIKTTKKPHLAEAEPQASRSIDANPHPSYYLLKRLIDVIGALVGLILLSPVFLILALLIRLDSRGPIFHRRRVLALQDYQQDGDLQSFDAFKFRTMVENADNILQNNPDLLAEYQKEYKLLNDPRVTRIGAKLRPLCLDELPQLFNVLRGQMSLVGPRMITPPELSMYGTHKTRLLSVKPGLTGLWQISRDTDTSYSERVRMDMHYIGNRSILLDLQILWRTIGYILTRRDAA